MARNQSSRGGNRRSNNNNPEGRNQYSGFIGMARERPATAAAVAAGAAAAGVFLWSRRGQISDQLGQLSDQIGEWTDNKRSERELEMAGGETSFGGSTPSAASEFASSAIGDAAARGTRPAGSPRRNAIADTGSAGGSGTMSGGSLDTGPSGRGGE